MATKKKVTPVEVKVETPRVTKGVCPICVNGRIPQSVEWHYVSCEHCGGTAIAH